MQEQQSMFYLINVIKNYKLDKEEVAKLLFPDIANPNLALRRLLTGKGHIYLDHLEVLAQYLGISVPALYEVGCNIWTDNSDNNLLCLSRGVYKVYYNLKSHTLIINKDNDAIFNDKLTKDISMQELLITINHIIDGTYYYK